MTEQAREPLPDMTLAEAFDLGFAWAAALYVSRQNLEDSRAVGRTLVSNRFDRIPIDLDGFDSFASGDAGMVDAKRRIKAALDLITPAASTPERVDPREG